MKRCRSRLVRVLAVTVGVASLAVLPTSPAEASPGTRSAQQCFPVAGAAGAVCAFSEARDASVCTRITWGVDWAWQCTVVLIATGVAAQPVSTGGNLTVTASELTCEWRKKGDGFNSNWGPWTSCSTSGNANPQSCSWGVLASPCSRSVQRSSNQIINVDTWGMTDCVEIRTSIRSTATARAASQSLTSATASARMPSSGTNVSGICEGGSAY